MGRKTKKLMRSVKTKEDYLKIYGPRIKRGDKTTPTYAQWSKASGTTKGLMRAGINWKKDKPSARLKRSKK